MSRYILGPKASLDMEVLWENVAAESISSADRWIARLFETFDALAESPSLGHKREELTPLPLLFWPVGSYVVIYREQPNEIEIIAIAQDAGELPTPFSH
jgi:plasmid stabilization system protein ParE